MRDTLHSTWVGIRAPFRENTYRVLFIAAFAGMFALFTLIPALTVVGNTIAAQLEIFTARDYAIVALLSGLYALFITMQVYVLRQKKTIDSSVGATIGGGVGALFAGVAGTAFCASCLAPLFALFGIGLGGVLFVLEYRFYFVAGITALMLVAIYLTARRVNRTCASCTSHN